MRRVMFVLTAVLVLFPGVPASTRADGVMPVISGIRVVRSGDTLGVEISANTKLAYTCYKMPQLLRVVIDIPRTDPGRPDTLYRVNSDMIATIKLEKKTINDVMITRVAVNLSEDADFTEQADPADNKKLTVYFRRTGAVLSTGAPAAAPQKTAVEKEPVQEQPPATAPAAGKTAPTPIAPKAGPAVIVGKVVVGADTIDIQSDGIIREYRAFTLREPGRMVMDIPAAQTSLSSIFVPSNRFGIVKARIGYFEGKLRVVFDTGQKPFPGYDVVKTGAGLRVVLKGSAAGRK
jgi:hypothetical protein